MRRNKINLNFSELLIFMKNHTKKEASTYFGVSTSTIERRFRDNNVKYYDLKYGDYPKELSNKQKNIIDGTMLGDATINKKCNYYCISQMITRVEYVKYIEKELCPFVSKFDIVPSNIEQKRPNDSCYVRSITSPIFKNERNRWYVGRKKIVPTNLKLNNEIVAHWYLNDGCNLSHRKRIQFATQSFSIDDVNFLRSELLKLGFRSTLGKDYFKKPIITIWQRDYFKFIEMIKPYVLWKCFDHKISVVNAPITLKGYGAHKVTPDQLIEIRKLYKTGKFTQKKLCQLFSLSYPTINKIINSEVFNDIGITGTADVQVTYKVDACLSEIKMARFINSAQQTI